jgi:hypothetical protein
MTYRLVLNDRSIRSLTDEELNGSLKSKLGYMKFRRVSIQKARSNTAPKSLPVGIPTRPKHVFYLFFENEAQANTALQVAKAIPIISLMKYRPKPCVGMKNKPIDVKPKVSQSHKVGTLPQCIVDIPRMALSKHRNRFADTVCFHCQLGSK